MTIPAGDAKCFFYLNFDPGNTKGIGRRTFCCPCVSNILQNRLIYFRKNRYS